MKKSHRLLRDASLVIVFCVGFLGLIGLANFWRADAAEQTSSEFSEYRLEADKAAEGRDLDVSLENLRALVKNDPFDGRAQHELASILYSRLTELQDAIAEAKQTELSNSTDLLDKSEPLQAESQNRSGHLLPATAPPLPSTSTSFSDSKAASASDADAEANEQVRVLVDQAIQAYQLAENHVRYRLRSQVQLAILLAIKGDDDAAMDSLEKFVDAGGATRRGLDQIQQFGSGWDRSGPTGLHANDRFLSIVNREHENRRGQSGFGRLESSSKRLNMAKILGQLAPTAPQQNNGLWGFLKRLNNDLVILRIKLVDFVRKLLE